MRAKTRHTLPGPGRPLGAGACALPPQVRLFTVGPTELGEHIKQSSEHHHIWEGLYCQVECNILRLHALSHIHKVSFFFFFLFVFKKCIDGVQSTHGMHLQSHAKEDRGRCQGSLVKWR